MFNSKKLSSLLLTGTMLLSFAACGGNNNATTAPAETNNQAVETTDNNATTEVADKNETATTEGAADTNTNGEKIEIEYWYAWKDKIGESKEELVKQFNESQDKYVVKAEYQGSYAEQASKTQAALAAGNPPAIFESEVSTLYTMAKGGLLQDLTDFVDDSVDMNDFIPGLMHEAYVDGRLYGLPFYRSTPIMYMNVDMLEAAGLDPKGPKTWEEFNEYAEKLRDKENGVYATSFNLDPWFLEAFVDSSGGYYVKDQQIGFNEEATKEPARWLKDLHDRDLIKVPLGEQASETVKQDFLNGKSAFYFTSTANLSNLMPLAEENGFKLDVAFVPANKEYAVPTGGANIVMVNGLSPEQQEAAWAFIKWATETEQNVFASSYTGYLPTRYSAAEHPEIVKLHEEVPQYKVAQDQLEYAQPRPEAIGFLEMQKLIYEGMTAAVTQGGDVDQVYDNLQSQAESLLSW